MQRITVDEVKTAYKETGFCPISGVYRKGSNCACPLLAVYCKRTGRNINDNDNGDWIGDIIENELCLHPDYIDGFLSAVDATRTNQEDFPIQYLLGFKDGTAVSESITIKGI